MENYQDDRKFPCHEIMIKAEPFDNDEKIVTYDKSITELTSEEQNVCSKSGIALKVEEAVYSNLNEHDPLDISQARKGKFIIRNLFEGSIKYVHIQVVQLEQH